MTRQKSLFLLVHKTRNSWAYVIQECRLKCTLRTRLHHQAYEIQLISVTQAENKEFIAILNTRTAYNNMVDMVMLVWMGS